MYTVRDLYDLQHSLSGDYLRTFTYPWEALEGISQLICQLGEGLNQETYTQIKPQVWVHKTAKIAPSAFIGGPCIIGAHSEVRHCAFIRQSALIGENCVVGNSTELKNVILFDGVQVPHFNYVGDSILGYKAHLGAGAITSNVRADRKSVVIHLQPPVETGRRKVGAMLGDFVEVGCNAVLNPGAIVGRHSHIYPTSCVRGIVPAYSIYKVSGQIAAKKE